MVWTTIIIDFLSTDKKKINGFFVSQIWGKYCGWLNFRGVPIFVVYVEGPIHEF